MPWRGAEYDGEFPTLGWLVLDWCAEFLPSPRDPDEPLIFTDDQATELLEWFALDPFTGQFIYRRGASRRSKGVGKSPKEAAKAVAEFAGPVRFDGWDANGNPVGRPWGIQGDPAAWVQIAAVSEDQTENTHSVVHYYLTANDGKAADALHVDPGLTRSFLRDGNRTAKLEPVTASAGTRQGQPITYGVMDETNLWTPSNGGWRLAKTLRNNASKMDGRTFETCNSFVPGARTVAEATFKAAEKGAAGVFYDAIEAPPIEQDDSDEKLREALLVAYGDSWWAPIDRLVADARDPDTDWDDFARMFLNWNRGDIAGFLDISRWEALADLVDLEIGTEIGVGFDGSISDDSTVLYGCTRDGYIFEIAAWERPDGAKDWRVPRAEVHEKVHETFDRFRVGQMFCDPPKWWSEIEGWAELYNSDAHEPVVMLDTNQPRRFAPLCDRFATAVREGSVSHDGEPGLTAQLAASAKKQVRLRDDADDGRTQFVIVKADTRKIDRAVGAVLALGAAMTMPEQFEEPKPAPTLVAVR